MIDDRDDVSGAPGSWSSGELSSGAATSLDIAREAAWSLATAYLDAGDQVSLQLVSHSSHDVARGAGARRRRALRAALTGLRSGTDLARVGPPRVSRGALVVLLSTVLDEVPVALAAHWRGVGHRVLIVDTLPRRRPERVRREVVIAERMVLADRDDRIRALGAMGAETVRWDTEPGERRAAMRALTRSRRRS